MNVGIIILAAGKSERLGQPKQMLPFNNKTLIKHIIDVTINTNCYPICVVVGANKQQIVPEIADIPVTLIDNPNYAQGISSSIKMGLVGVYMTQKDIDAVIILTCDMPYVSEKLINDLIQKAESDKDILAVASRYEDILGIPVLFKRPLFEEILTLSGDEGAKKILKKHQENITYIDFPEGKYDIDTMEDYQAFISKSQNLN